LNYTTGVEIKMTSDKGRGVFTTKSFKKGELIAAEKSIVFCKQN
jgi:hypothetical protein